MMTKSLTANSVCSASSPQSGQHRLDALQQYDILDTPTEPLFDDIVQLAADICDAPIAVVNFVAADRQWFKAELGIGKRELPLDVSICRHAILHSGVFVVPDLAQDPRFNGNPLVNVDGGLRFYAGAVLQTPEGIPIGTICVLDTAPRTEGVTERQERILRSLARQVMSELELRRAVKAREAELAAGRSSALALDQATRRLDAIINNTMMAIFVMNEQQECVFMNRAAEELTGYALDETLGRPLHDVIHHKYPDGRPYPLEECPIDRAFPERDQMHGEELFIHKDGSFYPVAFTASPIRDEEGRAVGTIIEARSIAGERARQAALRETEERFRLAVRATNDVIWDWDLENDQILWNEAIETSYGYNLSAVPPAAEWWLEHIHAEDRDRVHASIDDVIRGSGSHWSEEYRFRRANGDYAYVLDRGYVARDRDGRAARMIGAMLDLSERTAAEQALQESEARLQSSEARFRQIAELSPAITWFGNQDGSLSYLNPMWYEYTGQTPEEALPLGWTDVIHPEDVSRLGDVWEDARTRGVLYETEARLRRHDGVYRWFLMRALPVRDESGQITGWLGNDSDIDDHKKAEQALAEAVRLRQEAAETLSRANERLSSEVELRTQERDRIRSLFQQAPSFMCLLSGQKHVFELVNEAYLQLVGHRDLIGLEAREALPEVDGQGFFEILDNVYLTGEPFVGRNMPVQVQRTPTGPLEERFVHLVYQPVTAPDGSITGIFVDGYDVTHQKRAESALQSLNETLELRVAKRTEELAEALRRLEREAAERTVAETALRQAQKMDAIGKLTGGIAHDFNNLLQVVSGNLQLLSGEVAGNPKAARRIENAMAGVSRGAKLASQLLAFGRRQALEPKVVNVGRFITGMDDMLRRALGEEIEVETVISGGLWNTLVDPSQIENAILNLAINARDAMDGQGRLTIEAGNASLDAEYARRHEDVSAGQYVMIAVTDTGCGMPPEVAEKVFEPFYSTKPEGKGTGLGLSMVYGFVKQTGGHVKIYSEVGHGTTVKIYLPRVHQSEDVLIDASKTPAQGGTETVLVAEDDDEVRETAVALLKELGYQVLMARDATSALAIVESGAAIDLLFTDVVMPGPLKSPELARKAKERLPNLAVLFTSGYTENSIVHGGRLDPGVELLPKPYTREALARKIRHVLGNQAQEALTSDLTRRAQDPSHSAENQRLAVLLVEDNELIRTTTAEALSAKGHAVTEAGTAKDALQELASREYDILLADVGLPDLSGGELAVLARKDYPRLKVIFASGEDAVLADPRLSDCHLLLKPYDWENLEKALEQATASRAHVGER